MKQRSNRKLAGEVRIIGGEWRGRRVPVVPVEGLRPTGDRIRETLFNWLAPSISGMNCLDLFAGTGVLGLEALSRGAVRACFVEKRTEAATAIEDMLGRLGAAGGRVVQADALRFLEGPAEPFDLVFLDPPFEAAAHGRLCTLLARGWLAEGARVYLEMPAKAALPEMPQGWQLLREKTAGHVRYALVAAGPAR
ncbi:MAG: 16S rRNA (guanine(966)-N(2))-methyltransferase RsmD [Gammaproteobacteria bacterium]|nr:16S rRNA (guanine(966)-N(2))-methyltransferase RsmD [Gammaproteobacteria bacterium]